MPEYRLIVRNGIVVTTDGQQMLDVAVRGDTIAAIGPHLAGRADHTIDASGCYVLPGFIDPHVHISLPTGAGLTSSDDFATATVAAACGGTTTVIDFTTQQRGSSLARAADVRRAQAGSRAAIDFGLHLTVMDDSAATMAEMRHLAAQGYPSIKLYMTYPALMVGDEAMLSIMHEAAACGILTLVHAENHDIITHLTRQLLAAGHAAPLGHPLSRPPWAEGEAAGRAIALARAAGASLYVVHVSCVDALTAIARARGAGQPVFGETCPHYLLLSEEEYARPGFEGAKYVMTPPLRAQSQWPYLWDGLANGLLDVVATDHCPWTYGEQKQAGHRRFDHIPGGIAGIETRALLVFSEGVLKGRLSLQRFVATMSANPARLFGLYPRKGNLAIGSDADIVVLDPRPEWMITNAALHQHVDYTVFEGWPVTGRIAATISRGAVVARNGEFVGQTGHGRFVARSLQAA